jgi:anthranilate phosphoribosyltransferase
VIEAVRSCLQELVDGGRPDAGRIGAAFEALLSGETEPAVIAAFLTALRIRGESVEDIVAAARVMRARARRVDAPAGAVDTCGTGGLSWISLNTSTAAAFVAAGAGAVVAKHGNRSVPPKTGSADVLEALGVNLNATDEQLQACFERARLAFLFAPAHHSAMKHVAPVRKAMGIRTIFNLLGPLANPAGARRQVLGVFSEAWVEPYARALRELGAERAWVVHGRDGMDEISTAAPTLVAEATPDGVRLFELNPQELGVAQARIEDLRGGSTDENARAVLQVLEGRPSPFADLVAVNAAATLVVAGKAGNLTEGLSLARAAIAQGRAMQALELLRAASNG